MLAYYAHQHGNGHSNYAQIFARHSDFKMPVFTSSGFRFDPAVDVISMPAEDPDGTEVGSHIIPSPDYLHYSPVGQKSIQARSALFLNEIIKRSISLVIVDLSVEVAALCRSASVPYAYVRLPGKRNDPAHIQAFQGATFLLAYYPAELDGPDIPQWIKDKTIYTGFFSKFDITQINSHKHTTVVRVFTGSGGNSNLMKKLPGLVARFQDYPIEVFGTRSGDIRAHNLSYMGIHPDPGAAMQGAAVIVANCGLNLTSEILSLGKSFISIPEERPYEEQYGMHHFLTTSQLAHDVTNDWDINELINYRPSNLNRYVNQKAPQELIEWMQSHDYHPGLLRNSLSDFSKSQTQLKTA